MADIPKFKLPVDEAGLAEIQATMGGLLDRHIELLKGAPGCDNTATLIRTAAVVIIHELAREAQRRTLALDLSEEERIVEVCMMAEAMAGVAGYQLNFAPFAMKIVANFKLGEAVKRGLTVTEADLKK